MEEVRNGSRELVILNILHWESLMQLLDEFDFENVPDEHINHINRMWLRLQPWSDSVKGLNLMKNHFILTTLSNGNVSLLVNIAKFSGLAWDAILGPIVLPQRPSCFTMKS